MQLVVCNTEPKRQPDLFHNDFKSLYSTIPVLMIQRTVEHYTFRLVETKLTNTCKQRVPEFTRFCMFTSRTLTQI